MFKHQEEQSGGLTRSAGKQASQPTAGGDDRLTAELKSIGSSMTTSDVTRKRLGAEAEAAAPDFGRGVTAHLGEAQNQLDVVDRMSMQEAGGLTPERKLLLGLV